MPRYKATLEFKLTIAVEPDENGFHAFVPAFKGLHTCGDTEQEAIKNASDAAAAYIESLIKHKDPIPVGVILRDQVEEEIEADKPQPRFEELTVACAI